MRDALLKSFIRLLIFWFLVVAIWWGFSNARIAHSAASLIGKAPNVNTFNAMLWMWFVVKHWTLSILAAAGLAFLLGYGIAHGIHWRKKRSLLSGVQPDESWRDIEVSIGKLPHPEWERNRDTEPMLPIHFSSYKKQFEALPSEHRAVLKETLSVIAAHPDAYVGPGHTESLLEHTLNVLETTWNEMGSNTDPLLPLLSAAHDMGKIRAWKKNKRGEWRRVGWHDEWSARLFSGLDSFPTLPEEDKRVAMIALRYAHKFSRAPILPQKETERLVRLHQLQESADRTATAAEKQAVLEVNAESMPELLTRAFLESLTNELLFYGARLPKGSKASVWRRGQRLHLSEPAVREAVIKNLPENVAAAVESSRRPGEINSVTLALIDALRVQGWLVEALPEPGTRVTDEKKEVPLMIANPPLWNVRSGNINLNGLLVVNIPPEEQYRLGAECPTPILVLCPHFDGQGRRIDTKKLVVPKEFLEAAELETGKTLQAEGEESESELPPLIRAKASAKVSANQNPEKEATAETGSTPIEPAKTPPKESEREKPAPGPKKWGKQAVDEKSPEKGAPAEVSGSEKGESLIADTEKSQDSTEKNPRETGENTDVSSQLTTPESDSPEAAEENGEAESYSEAEAEGEGSMLAVTELQSLRVSPVPAPTPVEQSEEEKEEERKRNLALALSGVGGSSRKTRGKGSYGGRKPNSASPVNAKP